MATRRRWRRDQTAHDAHALSGSYALNTLDKRDRMAFEAHANDCESCRSEVAALQEAAAELSRLVATAPPPRLQTRVLAAATRTVQLRPGTVAHLGRSRTRSRLARGLVAAVVVLGIGGVAYEAGREPAPRTGQVTAETVFDASDARVDVIRLERGRFRVALSPRLGLLAVDADTPPLPDNEVYQLWVITDRARSMGVLEDGETFGQIPRSGRLAVTREPAGGSPQPTTVPLFAVDVSRLGSR